MIVRESREETMIAVSKRIAHELGTEAIRFDGEQVYVCGWPYGQLQDIRREASGGMKKRITFTVKDCQGNFVASTRLFVDLSQFDPDSCDYDIARAYTDRVFKELQLEYAVCELCRDDLYNIYCDYSPE